jgi:hypothetical protein
MDIARRVWHAMSFLIMDDNESHHTCHIQGFVTVYTANSSCQQLSYTIACNQNFGHV